MKINIIYPAPPKKSIFIRYIPKIVVILFLFGILACAIVNISVGGKPWSLFVLGAELIFWLTFIYHPLVENTFAYKISIIFLSICGYLILLDTFVGTGWSAFVVPIVCFSLLIILSSVFYLGFKKQKRNPMPLYWITLIANIAIISALIGITDINWPTIVLGSISVGMLIIRYLLFRKPIADELKKRFHT